MNRNTVGLSWWRRAGAGVGAGSRSRHGNRRRLRPEPLALEDRRLLTPVLVSNTNDSGPDSLREAIAVANVEVKHAQPVEIVFSPLFNTPQTITLTSGEFELSNKVNPEPIAAPAQLTIRSNGGTRVFLVDPGVTASFLRLTVTGGGGTADRGGGVLNFGNLTMTDCTISGNKSSPSAGFPGNGGGIANYGTATLNGCIISGNTSANYGGGLFSSGTATLTNSTVSDNTGTGGGGGLFSSGTTTLTDCTVSGDKVLRTNAGGGIINNGQLTVANSRIADNTAGGYGGGLWNGGTATLTNSTVSGNKAGSKYYGGGMYNGDTVKLVNCTFESNTAGWYGGGLYNNDIATLINCTFTKNTAVSYDGGGLYNQGNTAIRSCTFADNKARYGGGLYNNYWVVSMQNTIVGANTAPSGGPDVYGFVTSLGHNLISRINDSSGWAASDLTGTSAMPLNPLLESARNNGGPTNTMALLPASPAIHSGVAVPDITTDQRGLPLDSPPDIGAFQVQHPHERSLKARSAWPRR
jgi:hypothetical protein